MASKQKSSFQANNDILTEGLLSLGVDYIYSFRIVKMLYQDWTKTDAFKLGIIDDEGNKLKSPEGVAENAAYSPFIRLVFNMKRLIQKVPGGKFTSLAAAYMLMKESIDEEALIEEFDSVVETIVAHKTIDESTAHKLIATKLKTIQNIKSNPHRDTETKSKSNWEVGTEVSIADPMHKGKHVTGKITAALAHGKFNVQVAGRMSPYTVSSHDLKSINEDAPVNVSAGVADNPGPMGKVERRNWKDMDKFGGSHVFDVEGKTVDKTKAAKQRYEKWDKYITDEDGPVGQEILKFAKTYPNKGIILKAKSGEMVHLKTPKA
jgi:hypothetical protein